MKCIVPTLLLRTQRDLKSVQDGKNVHNINNKLVIVNMATELCRMENADCPGADRCPHLIENANILLKVQDWIKSEFEKRYGGR